MYNYKVSAFNAEHKLITTTKTETLKFAQKIANEWIKNGSTTVIIFQICYEAIKLIDNKGNEINYD